MSRCLSWKFETWQKSLRQEMFTPEHCVRDYTETTHRQTACLSDFSSPFAHVSPSTPIYGSSLVSFDWLFLDTRPGTEFLFVNPYSTSKQSNHFDKTAPHVLLIY